MVIHDGCINRRLKLLTFGNITNSLSAVSLPSEGILDRRPMILGPSCPNLDQDVLKIKGRVVLVRDFIGPSGLV